MVSTSGLDVGRSARFLCKRDLPWRRKFDENHDFGGFLVCSRVLTIEMGQGKAKIEFK